MNSVVLFSISHISYFQYFSISVPFNSVSVIQELENEMFVRLSEPQYSYNIHSVTLASCSIAYGNFLNTCTDDFNHNYTQLPRFRGVKTSENLQ